MFMYLVGNLIFYLDYRPHTNTAANIDSFSVCLVLLG